jgi:hypothetical protein
MIITNWVSNTTKAGLIKYIFSWVYICVIYNKLRFSIESMFNILNYFYPSCVTKWILFCMNSFLLISNSFFLILFCLYILDSICFMYKNRCVVITLESVILLFIYGEVCYIKCSWERITFECSYCG